MIDTIKTAAADTYPAMDAYGSMHGKRTIDPNEWVEDACTLCLPKIAMYCMLG